MMAGPPPLHAPPEKAHVLALLVEQFQKVNAVFGRRCYLLNHCVLVLGEEGTAAPWSSRPSILLDHLSGTLLPWQWPRDSQRLIELQRRSYFLVRLSILQGPFRLEGEFKFDVFLMGWQPWVGTQIDLAQS
jgi:hypothetical protein